MKEIRTLFLKEANKNSFPREVFDICKRSVNIQFHAQ